MNNTNTTRPSWDEYFMMAAKLVAVMATCPDLRVGAVAVKDRRIIASGFNGAPPGHPHCTDIGCLMFEGEGPACRRVVHAEHNAILQNSHAVEGAVLYIPYLPCSDCMKAIISVRVKEVVYEKENKVKDKYTKAKEFAAQSGIKLRQISEVKIIETLSRYYGSQEWSTSNTNSSIKEIVQNEEVLEF